jgi:hypothetical protein
VLAVVVLATTLLRLWVIHRFPEPDGDAKGHLGIAAALLNDPLRVALHWVWPPGYHYVLAGLLALGVTAQGVRTLNCILASVLPFMLLGYARRTLASDASGPLRLAPFLAAVLCAVMPIVNLEGTSAQQETMFTILVLGAVWCVDVKRYAFAGALLAVGTMIRYEAFGGVGLLAGIQVLGAIPGVKRRLPATLARAASIPFVVVAPAVLALAGWFLAHRVADGTWLGFLRELYRYTHVQRDSFHESFWRQVLWFPFEEPYYLFGLAIPLFFIGLPSAWRDSMLLPVGIYLFLLSSYAFKGVLGSARYYESLTPFVCLCAGYGAALIGQRWRRALPVVYAGALVHVVWLMVLMGRWTFHV